MISVHHIHEAVQQEYESLKGKIKDQPLRISPFHPIALNLELINIELDTEKRRYSYSEFDHIPATDFIQYAYRAILKRYPDAIGYNHYQQELLNGFSRKMILTKLLFSKEAKAQHVTIKRSFLPALSVLFYKIPILNTLLRALQSNTFKRRSQIEHQSVQIHSLREHFSSLHHDMHQIPRILNHLQIQINDKLLEISKNRMDLIDKIEVINEKVSEQDQHFHDQLIKQKNTIHDLDRKLDQNILQSQENLGQIRKMGAAYTVDDAFYERFESKFRGPIQEITHRLQVYVPFVQSIKNYPRLKGLDIGCGRGEWLRIMNDQLQVPTIGVDINKTFASNSDFQIVEGDIFKIYKQFQEESFHIITSFHLVEHITPQDLNRFIEIIDMLLAPGGVLILETPSPISISTSATNYYLDLTHRKPVHPATLQFLLEHHGFSHIETKYLQPHPHYSKFIDQCKNEVEKRMIQDLYGYQDYGIIVKK